MKNRYKSIEDVLARAYEEERLASLPPSQPSRKRKRRPPPRLAVAFAVGGSTDMAQAHKLYGQSEVFRGWTFTLVDTAFKGGGDRRKWRKEEVEAMLAAHGADVTYKDREARAILAQRPVNQRAMSIIAEGLKDVLTLDWALDCVRWSRIEPPLAARHHIHLRPGVWEHSPRRFDDFGDTFTRDTDMDTLRAVLAGLPMPTPCEVAEARAALKADERELLMEGRGALFGWGGQRMKASFVSPDSVRLGAAEALWRLAGGEVGHAEGQARLCVVDKRAFELGAAPSLQSARDATVCVDQEWVEGVYNEGVYRAPLEVETVGIVQPSIENW
jgi:hypothetical protein